MEIFANVTFWVTVSFVGFIGLIIKFGVPKMAMDMLDERAEAIRKELEEAAKLREEAQTLLASYQRQQREAEKEAEDIIAQAKKEATLLKEETEKALAEQIERRTELAQDKIAQAETQAMNEVKEIAAEVAVGAARTLLKQKVEGGLSADLIESSLNEVKSKLH